MCGKFGKYSLDLAQKAQKGVTKILEAMILTSNMEHVHLDYQLLGKSSTTSFYGELDI